MLKRDVSRSSALNLRVGDWVEVRSREEILDTLDEQGRLQHLPFMPEMLSYCGQRFRVFKRADKTCDYIQGWSIRRMTETVHLEGVRCDGAGHDGCQAGCLIFWKEAWLTRADNSVVSVETLRRGPTARAGLSGLCTVESILAAKFRRRDGLFLPGHGRAEIHFLHERVGSPAVYSRSSLRQSRHRSGRRFSRGADP